MFSKILIANRGEVAVRIIRACKEMGIETVAVYSEADQNSLPVALADERICIGSNAAADSYLNQKNIISAALASNAEAIHPGYGFLSENPEFAALCEEKGIIFIGPDSNVLRAMGDKDNSRQLMKEIGVPVVPGTEILHDPAEAKRLAAEIGYPILVKATAGGGGKGIRVVEREEDLEHAFLAASEEAKSAFGNGDVFLEKYLTSVRHVEMQVLADAFGNIVCLGERDCSLQLNKQKVLEETPCPVMTEDIRKRMMDAAVKAAKAANYVNAGTVEFLLAPDGNFYFIEMNTRLQVEHPVTEECTGVDLVRDMITVAAGNPLPYKQEDIKFSGAAIECRIYAEDPENNFMPSPGVITVREAPEGRNLRLDSAAYAGFEVSLHYDPMIAKLCCWGRTRESAISNMARALREYKILGIKTTIPFHQRVLKNAAFLEGKYDTTFIDTRFDKEDLKRRQNTDPTVAVIAAAVRHYEREKEAASRATTLPVVGESLWKYYGKLQMTANNY